MTLLEKLWAHRGGLVRLPTQLFWYGRGWDRTPGRICLLLDADEAADVLASAHSATFASAPSTFAFAPIAAHLLIDGQPGWVWVAEGDVEFL